MWKTVLFFAVVFFTLLYFLLFYENRHETVTFHFFHQKIQISLGLLAFGIFLDGAILAGLLIWLMN